MSNRIYRVWKVCPLHALFLARILWKCFQKLPFVWMPNEKVFQEKLSYSTMECTPSLECAPLFWCDETRALNARKMARGRSFPKLVKENTWGVCFFIFFARALFLWRAWHFNFSCKLWMEREKCTNLNCKKSLMNTFWKMMGLRIKAKFFSFFKRFVHGYHA